MMAKNLGIAKIDTKIFGKIYAPKNFVELAKLLNDVPYDYLSPEYWRGQSNIDWHVESTAVRRIKRHIQFNPETDISKISTLEEQVVQYEQRILNDARAKGFGYRDGRKLADLDLLASLQHYGAATRLIDFSRNTFIALWFACQSNPDKYGVLLGADIIIGDGISWIKDQSIASLNIEDILSHYNDSILIWEPQYLFERMRIQQSIFFFGVSHDGPWGNLTSLDFDFKSKERSNNFFAIAISPELKSELQTQWRVLFGYDVLTLFPDIEGFGRYHSSRSEFEWDFFSAPLD